jgi:uncharacterized surface protein with fasciclin (FAS1) repeats
METPRSGLRIYAAVVKADIIDAENGMIHIIDRMLLPPDLKL